MFCDIHLRAVSWEVLMKLIYNIRSGNGLTSHHMNQCWPRFMLPCGKCNVCIFYDFLVLSGQIVKILCMEETCLSHIANDMAADDPAPQHVKEPGDRLNIKMSSYQYRNLHGNPHTWERRSLYWDEAQDISRTLTSFSRIAPTSAQDGIRLYMYGICKCHENIVWN